MTYLPYFFRRIVARSEMNSLEYHDADLSSGYCLDRPEIAAAGAMASYETPSGGHGVTEQLIGV